MPRPKQLVPDRARDGYEEAADYLNELDLGDDAVLTHGSGDDEIGIGLCNADCLMGKDDENDDDGPWWHRSQWYLFLSELDHEH